MSDVAQDIRTNIIFNAQNAIRNASALYEALQKISTIDFSRVADNISKLERNLSDVVFHAKEISALGKSVNNFAKNYKAMDRVEKSMRGASNSTSNYSKTSVQVASEQENLLQRQKRIVAEMINLYSQDRNFNLDPLLNQLRVVNSKIAKMYLNMRQLGQAKRAMEDAINIAGPKTERYNFDSVYQQILTQMNDAKARLQQYQYDVDFNGTRARVDKYQSRLETLMANRNNPEQNFLDAAINLQRKQEKSFVNIEQKMMNELARLKFDRDSGKTISQHDLDARTQRIYNYAQRLQSLIDGGKVFDGQKFPVFPVVDKMLSQFTSGIKSITGEQKKHLEDQKTQSKIDEKKSRQQQKEYEIFEKSISPLLDRVNRLKALIDSKNSRGEFFSQKQLDSINSQKASLAQKLTDLTGKDYKKILDQWLPTPLTGIKESESQLQYIQKVRSALQKKTDKQTADEQKQIAQYYKILNRLEQKILDIRNEINRKNSRGELFSQKELDRYSDTLSKIKSQLQALTGSNEHAKIIDSLISKPKTGTIEQERALNSKIQTELALQKKQARAEEKARKQKQRDEDQAQKELERLERQREKALQFEQSTRSAIQRAQDKDAQNARKQEEFQANQREKALQYEQNVYNKLRQLKAKQDEKDRRDKEKADSLARSNEEKALNETIRINSKLQQLRDQAERKAESDRQKAARNEESLNQKRLNHLNQLEKKSRQVAEILARIQDKKATGGLFSIAEINRAQRQINRLVDDMNRISSVDLRPVVSSEFNKSIDGIQLKPKDQKVIDNSLATQLENARKKALDCASALENNRSIANQLSFMKSLNDLRNLEKQAGNVNKRLEKTVNLFENIGELVSKRMTWYFGDYLASMIYEMPLEFIQRYRDLEQAMAGVQQVMPLIEGNQAEINKEMSEFLQIAHSYAQDTATVIEAGQLWARGYGKGVLDNEIADAINSGLIKMDNELIEYASKAEAVKTSNELVAQSAMLATVDNFSLIESVKGLEAVLSAYGLRAESAAEATLYVGRAVDVVTKVAHYGQVSAQDLVHAIEVTGAAAAETGISLEFLSAMIETGVRNTALSGSNIGNAIKAFTSSVYTPKGTKVLAEYGISNTFIDENGIKRARNAQEIIIDIAEALAKGEKNAERLISTLAGGRMQKNKILMILQDPAEILRMWGEALNSNGFAEEQLKIQMETINAHIKQLKANFDSLINSLLSGSASNYIKKFVDMVSNGIKLVEDNLNGLKSVLVAFLALKFAQFGISFVASLQRMIVATKSFSLELQRAGVANSSVIGILRSGFAETGRQAISSFASGNLNATKQMQDSLAQLKSLQNQDTASKTANTAATVANSTATNSNTASRVANSSAIISNQASKVANTAATNALTAAELRQVAVSAIASAGLNVLIGLLVLGAFEIGKFISAEEELEDSIDKKTSSTKKDVDETEKSINAIKQEIVARKSAINFVDSATKAYLNADDAQSKLTKGSKDWLKQEELKKSTLNQLSKLFGQDAVKRIKESKDKAKAFEIEKKAYISLTDNKIKMLKELNDRLATHYDNRIKEASKQVDIYRTDLKNFGNWTAAQLEGLSFLEQAWSLFYQRLYNNNKKEYDKLEKQIKPYVQELQDLINAGNGDSSRATWLKQQIKELDLLQRSYSNAMNYYQDKGTSDFKKRLKDFEERLAELDTSMIQLLTHGDEIENPFDATQDLGSFDDNDDDSGFSSSKDNRISAVYRNDDFMQAMAAIAHQEGVDFKTSQLWSLAGFMSGNGDPWSALNSRSNNPFSLNRDFMDRYYPAGDINDIFDTSRALTEFFKENKGSVKDTFFAFLEAMFPNLSKNKIESKVQAIIDEADYLDTLYNFDKNLDDVRPRAKSNTYSTQLQKTAGQSSFDFDPADLETSSPTPEALYKYLRHYNYDHNAAKGWIVNISSESGLRADNVNPASGAFGLFQFYEDRKDRFFNWVTQNHRDPYSALSQLDYARLYDIPERGKVAGMSSYTDDFYIVPVPKVRDFSPESMNGRSALETSYIYKTRFEHPGEPYPNETLYDHMQKETSAFDFLDNLESNVERNLDSVGGNVLKMYAQGVNDCTLQATRAIMQAYTGNQYNASDWNFSTWFDDLTQSLKAISYDFKPSEKEKFESIIYRHFEKNPDRPIMLYQGRGAGSFGNHKINSHSGTHATVIGRKLNSGKYQVFDSAGSVTHELNLNEIFDQSAGGDSANGIYGGNMLIIPTVAPSNSITSWQIESGNAPGDVFNSHSNYLSKQQVSIPQIRETNLGLDASIDPQPKSGIILHHTDGYLDVFGEDASHRKQGWNGIGYHFFINKDGSIDRGRPEDRLGAHAQGSNVGNLGIALAGRYHNVDEMPDAQLNSLVSLLTYLCKKYNIDPHKISGHRDHNATDCPGDTFYYKFPDLIQAVLNNESQQSVPIANNSSFSRVPSDSQGLDSYWSINSKDFKTRRNSLSRFRVNSIDSILKKQHDLDSSFDRQRQDVKNKLKLEPNNALYIQDERQIEKDYLQNIIKNLHALENIQEKFSVLDQQFLKQHPEIINALNQQNSSWNDLSSQDKIELAKRVGDDSFADIINQEEKIRQAVIETNKKFDEQKQKILEMRDILTPEQIEDLELKNLQNNFEIESIQHPDDPTIERAFKRAQLVILRKRLSRQQNELSIAESITDDKIDNAFDDSEKASLIQNQSNESRKIQDNLAKTKKEIASLEQSLKDLNWLGKKDPFIVMKNLEDSKLSQLQNNFNLRLSENLFDDRLIERDFQRRKLDVLNQRLQRLKIQYSNDLQKDNDEKDKLLAEIELNQKNLEALKRGTNEFESQREKLDILKTKLENIGFEEKESLKNLRETEIEINNINKALDNRKFIAEQIAKIDSLKIQKLDENFQLFQSSSDYQSPSFELQYLQEKLALLESQKSHQLNNLQLSIADQTSRENVLAEQLIEKTNLLASETDFTVINRLQAEIDDLKQELDFLRQFGTDEVRNFQNNLNQTNQEINNIKKTIKDNRSQYSEDLENNLLDSAKLDFENESAGQLFDDGSRGKKYARNKLQVLFQRQARLQSEYNDAKIIGDFERSVIRDKLNEQYQIVSNTSDLDELKRQKEVLSQLQTEYQKLDTVGTDAELKIANQMKETNLEINETIKQLDPVGAQLASALKDGTKNLFSDILLEGKSFSESWKNLWSNIAQIALNQFLEMQLGKLFSSWFPVVGVASGGAVGYKKGGLINESFPRFDHGGDIVGGGIIRGAGTGESDSILTYLAHRGKFIRTSDGEYIIKQDTVEKLGVPFLDMLNNHPEAVKSINAFANGGNLGEEMIPSMSTNLLDSYKNFTKNQSEKESYDSRLERLMSQQNGLLEHYSQPVQQTTNMNINAVDSKSFVQLLNRHSDVLVALLRKEQSRRNAF